MKMSIIIPNRDGVNFDILNENFKKVLNDEYEIVIVTQDDADIFKCGQLFNIGYKYAKYDNLILLNNDIVFFDFIDFEKIHNEYNQPFSPWQHIQQCDYVNNTFRKTVLQRGAPGNGSCNFTTKEEFAKTNGYSNLYCGWGAEDDEYKNRVMAEFKRWIKMPITIGHLTHPKRENKNKRNTDYNYELLKNFRSRNYKLDGINDTVYDVVSVEENDNVKHVKVKNIRVADDFIYKDILRRHYMM